MQHSRGCHRRSRTRATGAALSWSESRVRENPLPGFMSGDWKPGKVWGVRRLQLCAWTAPDLTATAGRRGRHCPTLTLPCIRIVNRALVEGAARLGGGIRPRRPGLGGRRNAVPISDQHSRRRPTVTGLSTTATWRVVRPSIALRRPLRFCATCGVTCSHAGRPGSPLSRSSCLPRVRAWKPRSPTARSTHPARQCPWRGSTESPPATRVGLLRASAFPLFRPGGKQARCRDGRQDGQ